MDAQDNVITTHELKIYPWFFKAVVNGTKTFEIRKNDRDYKVGDVLVLHKYLPFGWLTKAPTIKVEVTYITSFKQKKGYVVMGIKGYYRSKERLYGVKQKGDAK